MSNGLTKSGDIQGVSLVGKDGVKLGAVREIFVDLATGQIEFIVVQAGGLLGGSAKFQPIPWNVVRYDAIASVFQASMTKDEFKAAPSYDREQMANSTYGWDQQSARYFAPPVDGGPSL